MDSGTRTPLRVPCQADDRDLANHFQDACNAALTAGRPDLVGQLIEGLADILHHPVASAGAPAEHAPVAGPPAAIPQRQWPSTAVPAAAAGTRSADDPAGTSA